MLKIEDIRALNIEVSSKCNANCAFCSRKQKIRPYGEFLLTLSDFKHLPDSFIEGLRRISFGGNFGDLCCNDEMPDIAKHIRRLNPDTLLEGDTNGSFQSEGWWATLGGYFNKGAMVFSIDGLEDTHRKHRKGTDFYKTTGNLRSFVRGGGTAHWKFIVFKHNEHQIKAAEKLAKASGCTRFYAVPSRDFDAQLEPPEKVDFTTKRDLFSQFEEQLKDSDRNAVCRPTGNRSLYIAADGTVHPCCFAHLMRVTEHNQRFRFILPLLEKYYDRINFKTRPIEKIINSTYFSEIMDQSVKNRYCMTKCNKYRKQIRRELVLHDRFFQERS